MFSQDLARETFDFTEANCLITAGHAQPQSEATDPTE